MADPRLAESGKVTISEDSMRATLRLAMPEDGIAYSAADIAEFLKLKGLYGGVIFANIEEMTQNNIYDRDYEIAKGQLPVEGAPGYYEFFFNTDKVKKPLIRSDGSVDYRSMSSIDNVHKGDKLVEYHPAVPGTHGFDVRGRQLRCQPCKEMQPLKISGVQFDEETNTYYAATDGGVDYVQSNNTLTVSDIYEVKGDVDYVVGKVDFFGDVVVHGNVYSGTYIRSSKSITVEGSVEAATLIAEGDIVLKKGLAGDKKAKVISGGSVYANFIEFATVEAKENVEANIIMNSDVKAGKSIVISGKRGAIVGGTQYSTGLIEATLLGNFAGIKTVASVGTTEELLARDELLKMKLANAEESLKKTNEEMVKVANIVLPNEKKEVKEAKLSQLNRRIKRDERMIEHIKEELTQILDIIAASSDAKVVVKNAIYAGTQILIDGISYEVKNNVKGAEFTHDRETEAIKVVQK